MNKRKLKSIEKAEELEKKKAKRTGQSRTETSQPLHLQADGRKEIGKENFHDYAEDKAGGRVQIDENVQHRPQNSAGNAMQSFSTLIMQFAC